MRDIFKKSFLEGYSNISIDVRTVTIALCVTAVISLYIFFAYRVITRKTFYSKNFNISLVGVALITAAIIVTIQSSVVVSLGMVGALSIVRFRTAIKDPIDLMFLFWSISTGIICGAGFSIFSVILAIVLTFVILLLDRMPVAKAPMILVVNSNRVTAERDIISCVEKIVKHHTVKSRNVTTNALDLVIELRTNKGSELALELLKVDGVMSANIMSHDGEVTF